MDGDDDIELTVPVLIGSPMEDVPSTPGWTGVRWITRAAFDAIYDVDLKEEN